MQFDLNLQPCSCNNGHLLTVLQVLVKSAVILKIGQTSCIEHHVIHYIRITGMIKYEQRSYLVDHIFLSQYFSDNFSPSYLLFQLLFL